MGALARPVDQGGVLGVVEESASSEQTNISFHPLPAALGIPNETRTHPQSFQRNVSFAVLARLGVAFEETALALRGRRPGGE